MPKKFFALVLALLMLASISAGCAREDAVPETQPTETAAPAATVPADGDPLDVTCKGSYTGSDPDAAVAWVGDYELTNRQLQAWYWLTAAAYRQSGAETAPDFSLPLDTQPCEADSSVGSWQQYFLKQALNTWHSVHALELQARVQELPLEEAYQPSAHNHETYMAGMPATGVLYGYQPLYQPNSMHEAFLAALPETLTALAQERGCAGLEELAASLGTTADALTELAHIYNYSYMYFTTLGYYLEVSEDEIQSHPQARAGSEASVDIRHVLLIPGSDNPYLNAAAEEALALATEADWEAGLLQAEELLEYWQKKLKGNESGFAYLAFKNSADTGTAMDGGAYRDLRRGQLPAVLEDWCFDDTRQPGDTTILRSAQGIHILYFCESRTAGHVQAETELTAEKQADLIQTARQRYPARIDYSAIVLEEANADVSLSDLLYPDIAHERFPEIPLYLQQDYGETMYGGHKLRSNGCGITSMAMVASYLADDELTPPEMCEKFGRYSHKNGTDAMIYLYEPPALGFYLRESTYENTVARAALEEGQIVISVQHKGYWTRGGHYIVLESIDEEGMVQVRDSNIFNYGRIKNHAEDKHSWGSITTAGSGFWIFEDKVTRLPACSRCGTPEETTGCLLEEGYHCKKCDPALLRRNTYLTACAAEN